MDFRLFLLRHAELLRSLHRWTIRVLVPMLFRQCDSCVWTCGPRDARNTAAALVRRGSLLAVSRAARTRPDAERACQSAAGIVVTGIRRAAVSRAVSGMATAGRCSHLGRAIRAAARRAPTRRGTRRIREAHAPGTATSPRSLASPESFTGGGQNAAISRNSRGRPWGRPLLRRSSSSTTGLRA